jgi:DNA repair exonuclease SbcCD ATPase subunit
MSKDERDRAEEDESGKEKDFNELDEIKEIRENYIKEIKERESRIQDKASGFEEKIREKEKELRELEAAIAEDLRELEDDPSEDLRDIIEDRKDERQDLLEEIRELREESREDIMERKEDLRERRQELAEKIREKESRARAKVKRQEYKARKVKDKVTRINISVPPDTSEEWREWSEDLGSSVSELVRKSMKFVKNNIGDLRKLDEFGKKMEHWGDNIEKAVEESGISDLGNKIKVKSSSGDSSVDKERIKRRITGLVKLQKGIPINKFAQALNKSEDFAENIIYELVAEGVEGELDEGVFKFSGDVEEVLSVLFELIDKI